MSGQSFNYKAVISYDGSAFFGWQRQPGLPTVQGTIEDSIFEALDEETYVYASSRTDRGVHALGQVISFKLPKKFNLVGMKSLLDSQLPPAIRIRSLDYAPDNFIARFESRKKVYSYIAHLGPSPSPFVHNGSWVIDDARMNMDDLERAFGGFVGMHDFVCFGKSDEDKPNKDTHCTLELAQIEKKGEYLIFLVKGDRFLHNMVRRMVSFAIFCGQGKEKPERLERIFAGELCLSCAYPAPPQGLYLVKVEYNHEKGV